MVRARHSVSKLADCIDSACAPACLLSVYWLDVVQGKMTPAMIAEHELRTLFDAVDVDGSGGIAITYLPTCLPAYLYVIPIIRFQMIGEHRSETGLTCLKKGPMPFLPPILL